MALLHSISEECLKTELDLFTVPLTQTAIEENTYIEVPPLSAISDSTPLEFFIAGTGEDYVELNNTLLFLRLKITNPDGTDIADGAPVGLINYPGATIFSQVDVSLGDRLISQSSNTYPYRCIIECLINYGKDALETLFSAGLFYKDTAGHMDAPDPAGGNRGLTKRAAFTNASNVVELFTPVHSDIFFQEKLMLNGVDIKIQMTRGKDEFCLMRSDNTAYKLKILSASLFVKKVSVSPAVRLGHAQALLSTTAKVCTQENLLLGTLPKSIVLAMVDNDAFVGAYDKNPFAFKNYDL
ncbi:hypothetical protein IRJ41_024918 [Triplophysa rosa]|uniref:Uncharacterized protein n=1 Tax=Triplophysa rosa TaxID=992332 RepID=A0A9W7TMB1_TRIRA|nr:hypothetical protein IRJ41_024918 [Triplophysa rosa]